MRLKRLTGLSICGSRKTRVAVGSVVLALVMSACGSAETDTQPSSEEDAVESAETVPATAAPETTEVVTTTSTTSTTTTTIPPTTTTRPSTTTTTVDPVEQGVFAQITVMSFVETGDPQGDDFRDQVIAIADGLVGSIGRIDVVTAEVSNEVGTRLIVEGVSGFLTDRSKQREAIDFLSDFASLLWTPQGIGNILESGAGGVDFDYTMDGQNWVIPAQTMIDIVARRTSAESVLGF